jgi:hypothetical protein
MALSYYHLIPESTYAITSVSSRRPCTYETTLASFLYRKIKPALFFGCELVESQGKRFKIASPEKAILDYFYLAESIPTSAICSQKRISNIKLI